MTENNEHSDILSQAEKSALYEFPDFDNDQRIEYFIFNEKEKNLIFSRAHLTVQFYCALQIGYFKAKQLFFRFKWADVSHDDILFVAQNCFDNRNFNQCKITKYEFYTQCEKIANLFCYQRWLKKFSPILHDYIADLAKRDINTSFIVMEVLSFLQKKKIIRPGYTILQKIMSRALYSERNRIIDILGDTLSKENKEALQGLLKKDDILSDLAALKQDPKNFKPQSLSSERSKLVALRTLYTAAKAILPKLELSKKNIDYYASLAHYYNIYELREKLIPEQTYLYLLCYIWTRYQQINDNLISAFCYHINKFNEEVKVASREKFSKYLQNQQNELVMLKQLARLYVDKNITDDVQFGEVRKQVFAIISETELTQKILGAELLSEMDFRWKAIDAISRKIKNNLKPIIMELNFESDDTSNAWIKAINWLKSTHDQDKNRDKCPDGSIPKRLKKYIFNEDKDGNLKLCLDRYEFWIYRQLKRRISSGEIYLNDSIDHRSFNQELVSIDKQHAVVSKMNIPAFTSPINEQLDALFSELHDEWQSFNKDLSEEKLLHLRFQENPLELHLKKKKDKDDKTDEELQDSFYSQLPLLNILDVLRYVNKECGFLSAFTPLQSRYTKQDKMDDSLFAIMIAQAMNHGNLKMAGIANFSYPHLQNVYTSYFRLATLKKGNDIISDKIASLPIFSFYSIDLSILYSAVDGQKFEVKHETTKARYSKKYWGKAKGVVAYTLLANHIPLQLELIGTHQHESYYAFDIWYNNTTSITPTVLTGDMHSINKANFAIMHWFGGKLHPRFSNIQSQLKHLYCAKELKEYEHFLIKPVKKLDRGLIETEWSNLVRIIATLSVKEITQGILIKKLCNYTVQNQTRMALFEFDKLIRSIYTLKYLHDPQLQSNIHKSQNRVESYHQLRGAIAQAYGKKQLIGKTDIAVAISNECGRLIANAIIYYNSAVLSRLKQIYEETYNTAGLKLLKRISPVAWQHIHFLGHYIFSNECLINLEEIVYILIKKTVPLYRKRKNGQN